MSCARRSADGETVPAEPTLGAGWKCTVVPVEPGAGIGISPVTGMSCSYRWVQAPVLRRLVCTSQVLSAARVEMPRRGCPSGSSGGSAASKNRRSRVAITGFFTGWPAASWRVSVPRPSSATDTDPSG